MHLGIKLARQLGLHWVIFELDSKVVVDMINSGSSRLAYLNPLTQDILSLLRDLSWCTSVVHTYREGNRGADFMARQGVSASTFDWVVVDYVCHSLGIILADDVRGSVLPRSI